MTDEEIEKALVCCDDIADCNNCPYMEFGCKSELHSDVQDYIKRLKEQVYQTEQKLSECENGYQATLDLERRMRADDKEQIRKDTAKEILQPLFDIAKTAELYDTTNITIYDIKVMAKQCGVEVDDE